MGSLKNKNATRVILVLAVVSVMVYARHRWAGKESEIAAGEHAGQADHAEAELANDVDNGNAAAARARTAMAARPTPTNVAGTPTVKVIGAAADPLAVKQVAPLPTLPPVTDQDWAKGKFSRFSAAERRDMVNRCELRWQLPPYGSSPELLSAEHSTAMGLGTQDRDVYNRVLTDFNQRFVSDVRSLYDQMTGDTSGGTLNFRIIMAELRRSANPEEQVAVARALAQAGETADDSKLGDSIYARYIRLQLREGDAIENALARELGPTAAQQLRDNQGPRFTMTGCEPESSVYRSQSMRP